MNEGTFDGGLSIEAAEVLRAGGVESAVIVEASERESGFADRTVAVTFSARPRGLFYYAAVADLERELSTVLHVRVEVVEQDRATAC